MKMDGAGLGEGGAHFGQVRVQNAAGVVLDASFAAAGTVSLDVGAVSGGEAQLGGDLVDVGRNGWAVGDTTLLGAGPLTLPLELTGRVRLAAPRTLAAPTTIHGALTLDAPLTTNAQALVVDGPLEVAGPGALVMTTAGDDVTVNGVAHFAGANGPGTLTAGVLTARGDVKRDEGSALLSTGTVLVLGASERSGPATEIDCGTAARANHWRDVRVQAGARVVLHQLAATGDVDVRGDVEVPADGVVTVGGALHVFPRGSVRNGGGSVTVQDCTVDAGGVVEGVDACVARDVP